MTDHIEIERKYVISMPDTETMRAEEGYTVSDIVQIYLESAPHVTHRVRSRTSSGVTKYTETKKVRISGMSAYEDEREIEENEFLTLVKRIAPATVPVIKTRHTFIYHGQLFEVDIYPNWHSTAIMETELPTEDTTIDIPPFIRVIKEVTGIKEYSNASMSRKFPKEITE